LSIHCSLFTVSNKQKIPPQGDGIVSALPPRFPRSAETLGRRKLMTSKGSSPRPVGGAQSNELSCKSLFCEESGNDAFRFPWSKKARLDFLRPYKLSSPLSCNGENPSCPTLAAVSSRKLRRERSSATAGETLSQWLPLSLTVQAEGPLSVFAFSL
jgi:hypothetical protein